MASLQSTLSSNSISGFDVDGWVVQIRLTLDDELEEDTEIPVSIFKIPKNIAATSPDSYVPQLVAFGPYHLKRPDLYDMHRLKLSAAKRTQRQLQNLKFQHIAEELVKHEPRIRAYYNKYLDFNGETLAWMMAVDASLLLEFLQIIEVKLKGRLLSRRMSNLFDMAGTKCSHNAILRDMVMLENQIPLFLLRKVLEIQLSSIELADCTLNSMLMGLYKELSPFKWMEEQPNVHVSERAHLLDFFYGVIVPELPGVIIEVEEQEGKEDEENSPVNRSQFKQFVYAVKKLWPNLKKILFKSTRTVVSKPLKVLLQLPIKIIANLPIPGFRILKRTMGNFNFPGGEEEDGKPENDINKPPLMEEISIRSVTELSKSGVNFSPTNGGLMTLRFDCKTSTLYLPAISVDENTEVILRNLVAYEACKASGQLIFTRYTEFMNGIIDTEEDAKLLREKGIVMNRLKCDEDVAKLWNGMSTSVNLTKVEGLDKVIGEVNKYYDSRWNIKAGKFMKVYVYRSWQCLTLFATIMLLLMVGLQSFCTVYSCANVLHHFGNADMLPES